MLKIDVVLLGIIALSQGQNHQTGNFQQPLTSTQFQASQPFPQRQERFQSQSQPQAQIQYQFQDPLLTQDQQDAFQLEENYKKAISGQRLRKPTQSQLLASQPARQSPSQAPRTFGSFQSVQQTQPLRSQQPQQQQQFLSVPPLPPTPQRQQPVRQHFFDQSQSFTAPQDQQTFEQPRPIIPATKPISQDSVSLSFRKPLSQKQTESEYNDEIIKHQAENAKYSFAASVSDTINDQQHTREEVRDGLKLRGMYSYSDGYFKRTVTYEADENGYRVIHEETEPLGDGPQENPDGQAEVTSNVGGSNLHYTISNADIPLRKPHQPVQGNAGRNVQQPQTVFTNRQQHFQDGTRNFQQPTQAQAPLTNRQTQQFQENLQQQF